MCAYFSKALMVAELLAILLFLLNMRPPGDRIWQMI